MASTEPGLCIPAHTAAPSTFPCTARQIPADMGTLGCCQRELGCASACPDTLLGVSQVGRGALCLPQAQRGPEKLGWGLGGCLGCSAASSVAVLMGWGWC